MNGKRSFRALDIRARDPSVSIAARGLWRIIDTFARTDGTGAFPSHATLRSLVSCGRDTLFVLLDELDDAGWIARYQPPGKSNCYTVIYPTAKAVAPVRKISTGMGQIPVRKISTTTSAENQHSNPYH